jgi:Sulfatase
MSALWQDGAGVALPLAGWMAPRLVAGTWRVGLATLLDAAPVACVALLLFAASGRPVFAGSIAFALGAGFAGIDRVVRGTLREPVVFSALSELPQVFTHPHLYLPFAGTGTVIGGAGATVLAAAALLIAEPAATAPHPAAALTVAAGMVAALWRAGREPWLGAAARGLRRLGPSGEPFADAARLGPVAMLIAHGIIARAERPARRARLATSPSESASSVPVRSQPRRGSPSPAATGEGWGGGRHPSPDSRTAPIVLVQCESFFDARRALPRLPRGFFAGFDRARGGGLGGRLLVPAWGANTMRAEFAVLSGIAEAALGYDRFNPYHALARGRIASQVWRLRAAGYRTVCLHPFDRRFFRRDLAIPALGFELFLGRETLGGGRKPPYMSDPELAEHVLRVVDEMGPRVFVFAITMGNHGPWLTDGLTRGATPLLAGSGPEDAGGRITSSQGVAQGDELRRYLGGLRRSDEMLDILIDGLERRAGSALLGFYGDHLPSLPRAFAHLGFDDWRSDYVIWGGDGAAGCRDLAAHELGRAIVDMALASAPSDAVVAAAHPA